MPPFSRDSSDDPQETMPPRRHDPRRIAVPEPADPERSRGRRLKLGTPTRATVPEPESEDTAVNSSVHRGFKLGGAERTAIEPNKSASKAGVQPWILVVAGGAMLLLLVALLLRPSSPSSSEAAANDRLLRQYTQYLETKNPKGTIDVPARQREVVGRLQAVAWAKAVGDRSALENELRSLLFMDDDKNSPLYQYSVSQLKQLPAKKSSGL